MGQNTSLPRGRKKSLRTFSRKIHGSKNNLSHTFNIIENNDRQELLNINIASEEELMTLPGVNREIARNIVDHRRLIGRFRRVEDLALVRGVGAEKLETIRPEICVSSRRNQSCVSSRAQSYDSLKSADSKVTIRSNRLVNVNKASVFELQSVHGINQLIAAAIVNNREKKGPFKQVEDLRRVKCIDQMRLNNIARYLTVEENEFSDLEESRPSIITNGFSTSMSKCNGGPAHFPMANGLPQSSIKDIFELLSAYSPRPILEENFRYCRNSEPAFRAASWNLHKFSYDKANNLGVKEVICRTILENGWSIIAVQDVTDVSALRSICDELNKPKLRRIEEWRDKNHSWNFCMLDIPNTTLGFIYDSDGPIDIELISLNEGPEDTRKDCEVLIATFTVAELNLQLVNLSLFENANIKNLSDKITDLISEQDNLLLFIDFSNYKRPEEDVLGLGGLRPVFSANQSTVYVNSRDGLATNNHSSNILCNNKVQGHLTGLNGVVRHGITHFAIPNGWSWGGPASPFCPLWVELFFNSNSGTAL